MHAGMPHGLICQIYSYRNCPCASMITQVDGAYEDWVEVLRLIYYSGKNMLICCVCPYR